MPEEKITIYCDGASRGNPGPASFGVVAFKDQADVSLNTFKNDEAAAFFVLAETLGKRTNNEAEYAGIIAALKKCSELALLNPTVCSDSELVIKQLRGEYKVKNENLKIFFKEAKDLADRVKPVLKHVPREKNQIADFLANRVLDNG